MPATPAPHRILVVDDEPDICANLADILRDLGYTVDVAHNGQQALALVERQRYAVALLDLRMPGMDGLELYRRIKAIQSDAVGIIVTAHASGDMIDAVLRAGAWKVIAKPIDLARLLPWIEEAAEQPLVLVVDDDSELCDTLWELLREHGFRVAIAHNADAAGCQLASGGFQVVLIDMRLPEGDGTDVFREVRKSNPQAKTVLITGYPSEMAQLVAAAQAEGADAICYKPFDVANLLKTVSRLAR